VSQQAVMNERAAGTQPDLHGCWHVITNEYPPQTGGVSDYTQQVARALVEQGDEVHVWCPAWRDMENHADGVQVHRQLGSIAPSDLRRVDAMLDAFAGPRRILVQWVPTGYGYKSMNLPFCWWLRNRAARHGDGVEIMLHEPFLDLRAGSLRGRAVALVHRLLTIILLRSATRVWMTIPAWEQCWRPYALGRRVPFHWLPVPSNIPVVNNPHRVQEVRHRYRPEGSLIGHFGTYGTPVTSLLEPIVNALGRDPVPQTILLMGIGSQKFREAVIKKHPELSERIQATGALAPEELSCHISACDLLIQPYPDGVSSRRTSFMAGLSHGIPVITTAGLLTEDLWAATGAVPIAAAGDIEGFVQLVRHYRDDPEARATIGSAARRLYADRFEVRHVAAKLRSATPATTGNG